MIDVKLSNDDYAEMYIQRVTGGKPKNISETGLFNLASKILHS